MRLCSFGLLVAMFCLNESQAQTQEEMDSQMFAGEAYGDAITAQSTSNTSRDQAEQIRSDPIDNDGAVEERVITVDLGLAKGLQQADIDMDLADGDDVYDEGVLNQGSGLGKEVVGLGHYNGGFTDFNDAEWLWDPPLPNVPDYADAAELYDASKTKFEASTTAYNAADGHFTDAFNDFLAAIVEYDLVEADYALLP